MILKVTTMTRFTGKTWYWTSGVTATIVSIAVLRSLAAWTFLGLG